MADKVVQEFSKIVDAFAEMRNEMRNSQHSANLKPTDDLYEAIRKFAPNIGCLPPYIPIDPDEWS